jgi:hypothetical protein
MINRLNLIFLTVVFLLFSNILKAQFSDSIFMSKDNYYSKGTVLFEIDNLNYFSDLEYFNPMVYSYTMAGFHLSPLVSYQLTNDVKISAGAYMLNILGREEIYRLRPVYTLEYSPAKNLCMRFGTIKGAKNHNLVEQIFSYKEAYTYYNEEGIQLTYKNNRIFSDVWLNWRYLSLPNDDKPELIFGGYSFAFNHDINVKSNLKYFTQLVTYHIGGQDLVIERHLSTYMNFVSGYHYVLQVNNDLSIGNRSFYAQFVSTVAHDDFPYLQGYGLASELQVKWKFLQVLAGYWYGNRFYNPLGEFQFSSVSEKSNYTVEPERQVIYGHVALEKEYENGLKMGVRAGLYLSPEMKTNDFYVGIIMKFNHNFVIAKLKNDEK